PAGPLGVRVVEEEPLADQARVIVERRAVDESVALLVYKNPGVLGALDDVIAFLRSRLPGKHVAQPGAAPGLDADTEPAGLKPVFLGHFSDELARVLADLKHLRRPPARRSRSPTPIARDLRRPQSRP